MGDKKYPLSSAYHNEEAQRNSANKDSHTYTAMEEVKELKPPRPNPQVSWDEFQECFASVKCMEVQISQLVSCIDTLKNDVAAKMARDDATRFDQAVAQNEALIREERESERRLHEELSSKFLPKIEEEKEDEVARVQVQVVVVKDEQVTETEESQSKEESVCSNSVHKDED
eukprot:g12709.t1